MSYICEESSLTLEETLLVKLQPMKKFKCDKNGDLNNFSFPIKKCIVRVVRDDLNTIRDLLTNSASANHFDCNICAKTYSCEKSLQKHKKSKHLLVSKVETKPQKRVSFSDNVIVHNIAEYHHCRKCTKLFESYSNLKVHMRQEHKKRKSYICYYCTKKFVDRTIFKVHIKLHCDMCSQFFMNKRKLCEHKRSICNVIKNHKCNRCEEVYLSYSAMKDHMFDHPRDDFICNTCKEQFKSKCSLRSHSKRHLKELNMCNSEIFCDEAARGQSIIEDHVLQLPEPKKISQKSFSCDHCNATFEVELEYLRHQWAHSMHKIKFRYKIGDPLPDLFNPKIVLNRIRISDNKDESEDNIKIENYANGRLKNQLSVRKRRRIQISQHQCEVCMKYFSNNYTLKRHVATMHVDEMQCAACEEVFAWPQLLKTHKCIRHFIPEVTFDDARPEVPFHEVAPEVHLPNYPFCVEVPIEYDVNKVSPKFTLVLEEVPIEF